MCGRRGRKRSSNGRGESQAWHTCGNEEVKIRGKEATHASGSGFKCLRVYENLEGRDSTKTKWNFPVCCQNLIRLCLSIDRLAQKAQSEFKVRILPLFSLNLWFFYQITAADVILIGPIKTQWWYVIMPSDTTPKWLASILLCTTAFLFVESREANIPWKHVCAHRLCTRKSLERAQIIQTTDGLSLLLPFWPSHLWMFHPQPAFLCSFIRQGCFLPLKLALAQVFQILSVGATRS